MTKSIDLFVDGGGCGPDEGGRLGIVMLDETVKSPEKPPHGWWINFRAVAPSIARDDDRGGDSKRASNDGRSRGRPRLES
jgi:hypothetical protein